MAVFTQATLVLLVAVAALGNRGETPLGSLVVAAVSEPPGCPDGPLGRVLVVASLEVIEHLGSISTVEFVLIRCLVWPLRCLSDECLLCTALLHTLISWHVPHLCSFYSNTRTHFRLQPLSRAALWMFDLYARQIAQVGIFSIL